MRKDITVAAEQRPQRGKNAARRLRQRGLIPAIVYGAFQEPVAVAVNPKELEKILHSKSGHNTIFNVGIEGSGVTPAMIVDYQYDPFKDTLLHADLKRIDLTKRIVVSVPVTTHGEPKGVKQQDGLLEIVTREVTVECLPEDIPESYSLDVTELMIGQSLRAGDIPLAAGVKLMSSPDNVIAHVVALRQEEEAPAAATPEAASPAGATGSEPEVIKKGKKEEEAAAEEKGKKK
ncbi:MAG: 50S ribosomal protein L25 [Acidobacteriota bacterium]